MSSSACISSNPSSTLINPESESPFSRLMDSGCGSRGSGSSSGVRVVDSKSCRQMYVRTAYTFTRQEDSDNNNKGIEKAKNCFGRVKERVTLVVCKRDYDDKSLKLTRTNNNKGLMILSKVKEISYTAFLSMIRRMLACTSKVDVAEH